MPKAALVVHGFYFSVFLIDLILIKCELFSSLLRVRGAEEGKRSSPSSEGRGSTKQIKS